MVERLTNLISIFQKPKLDFSKNRAEHDCNFLASTNKPPSPPSSPVWMPPSRTLSRNAKTHNLKQAMAQELLTGKIGLL